MSSPPRSPSLPQFLEKARAFVFPPCGWRRAALVHWNRLLRLKGSDHSIALGMALGVFISFTPLLGGRLVIAGAAAMALRASVVAAAIGTHVGNPLVYPALFVGCVELGAVMLGRPVIGVAGLADLSAVLAPALVGLTVAGGLTSLATYLLVLRGVRAYQMRRRARFVSARSRRETEPCRTAPQAI
jgi:uncharacterized protein (DUF2062 family)